MSTNKLLPFLDLVVSAFIFRVQQSNKGLKYWNCMLSSLIQITVQADMWDSRPFPAAWWCRWYTRCEEWVKLLPQTSHVKGFTLECVRWCETRLSLLENSLLQKSHLYGFSPVWICQWITSCLPSEKDFPHTKTKLKLNSVALVRERTIPTERPPPVGEVSANSCG